MTQEERDIKSLEKRITEIWDEMEPVIAGTGVSDLIEELVDKEIELEQYCNR